ncbi:uncharacterized protein LOC114933423 [Nylanderia fulva]|uniref:uncharacterized protein LOC114933423 n=1 Tax=Nylanderia fulva TaxID=613905 RepID=UPI0010FB688E|nr:uncharacterized protein LOC114933423 [Nylanderia fulva]
MAEKSNSSIKYRWMWYYLRRDESTEYEICNICNMPYTSSHHFTMLNHIAHAHPITILKKHFTLTQNNGIKCNYCPKIYMASINLSKYTRNHLTNEHKLNENIANELKIWVNDQLLLIKKCESCDQFKDSDIFNKMVHLVETHRVIVLPKFIPTGLLSSRLYNLFHRDRNTADIPTSSSNQLQTCNTLRTYVDNFCSDLSSDRAVESTKEDDTGNLSDIAPSSSLPSAYTAEDMSDVQASSINYRWMWYYLRRDTKYEICNICDEKYCSTHIVYMKAHIQKEHPDIHNKSEETPFFTIRNNEIKCNYCLQIYKPSFRLNWYMQRHIIDKHKLNENIANKLKIWVNQQLDIIEKCETCKQFEKLDIFNFMVHLHRIHDVTVPSNFIPTGLKNCTWMWYYLKNDTKIEICNICDYQNTIAHRSKMLGHVSGLHFGKDQPSELDNTFTPTETNGLKCNYCSTICMPSLNPCTKIQWHIIEKHKLNEDIANELKTWVNVQLPLIEKCESCNQLKKFNIFNIMVHLVEAHRVIVPPKFIPTRLLSPRLYNLFHRDRNTADISTFSSNQLQTCKKRIYVDNFCSDLNSDRAVESTEEGNRTNLKRNY